MFFAYFGFASFVCLVLFLVLISFVWILAFYAKRKEKSEIKQGRPEPEYPKLDSNKYELFGGLYVQQIIRHSSTYWLEVQLKDSSGQILDHATIHWYMTPYFEPVQVSPDGKSFAVFAWGRTPYEEWLDYCAVYKVEQNKLVCLYDGDGEGEGGRRYRYKPKVSFGGSDGFQVQWEMQDC